MGALVVRETCGKNLPEQLHQQDALEETGVKGKRGLQSTCCTSRLLPVGHLLHGVKVMAHIESSRVAEVGNAQVEVEHFLFVTLQLHWHANGSVFPLLHQSQVFQQTGSFLLARAKKNSDASLDKG